MDNENIVTGDFTIKGVPYSEFEQGHAFAFRSFNPTKILQRRFFAEFGFGAEMTDDEIIASFNPYSNEKLKDSAELEHDAETLSDLIATINSYLKRIDWHCRRLERYINAAAGAIADGDVADVEAIRCRYKRGQHLKNSYALPTYVFIKCLRDKAEKMLKKLADEANHFYRKTFADRLKFARQKTGLSQRAFAPKLNMSQNGYALYETGQRDPSIPTLIRLSKILNRPVDWLLGQTEW